MKRLHEAGQSHVKIQECVSSSPSRFAFYARLGVHDSLFS